MVVTSGLVQDATDADSILTLCTLCPIVITSHDNSYGTSQPFLDEVTSWYAQNRQYQSSITNIIMEMLFCICWLLSVCFCLLLFYTIATVFQSCHGGDLMYEMRRRKLERTLLQTQGICNFPHHIGMV